MSDLDAKPLPSPPSRADFPRLTVNSPLTMADVEATAQAAYPLVWRWTCRLPERKGQRCRVIARGRMNSVCVEFPDGYRVITSGWAVRKV